METSLRPASTDLELAAPPGRIERREPRQRPQRALPTDRLKLSVQAEALRAYARLSGAAQRPVSTDDLAKSVGLSAATAGLSNTFFQASGWIERRGKGLHVATEALVEHGNLWSVSPDDDAWEPLREPMRQSWYWTALRHLLEPRGLSKRDAVIVLMKEAGASGDHMRALDNLLDWLVLVGLLEFDGSNYRSAHASGGGMPARAHAGADESPRDEPVVEPQRGLSAVRGEAPAPGAARAAVPEPTTEQPGPSGVFVNFNFHVWLAADDLVRLQPDQIRATFDVANRIGALAKSED